MRELVANVCSCGSASGPHATRVPLTRSIGLCRTLDIFRLDVMHKRLLQRLKRVRFQGFDAEDVRRSDGDDSLLTCVRAHPESKKSSRSCNAKSLTWVSCFLERSGFCSRKRERATAEDCLALPRMTLRNSTACACSDRSCVGSAAIWTAEMIWLSIGPMGLRLS